MASGLLFMSYFNSYDKWAGCDIQIGHFLVRNIVDRDTKINPLPFLLKTHTNV